MSSKEIVPVSKPGPKARKEATTLPGGCNVLSKAIATRLKLIREERGVDEENAAKQCGLTKGRWKMFEAERAIPTQDESERICRWAFEGINFWSYPLAKERREKKIGKGDGWKTHKYNVPRETDIRIVRTANRLGISISAMTQIAIEQFLDSENVVSTYKEAARRVKQARIIDRVNEDPYLQSFLSGDLDIAISMGAKLKEPPKKEKRQAPAERLMERFYAEQEDEWEILS
jgi:transcriptional regulator with XRE-family HTH domain